MRALWQMWEGLLDPKSCDEIVEVAMQKPPVAAAIGVNRHLDKDYRDSDIRWLSRTDQMEDGSQPWKELYALVEHHIQWANANAFGVDLSFLRDLQFTTYMEQRHQHFNWHCDTFWISPNQLSQRKLSAVLQLTDPSEYQGCDLELDIDDRPCPMALRKQGTLLVFPSFLWHRVTPILGGTRNSLVAWFDGNSWR